MKMKHHTVFILQNKFLKIMLIHYYYRIIKISVIFQWKVLIDLWLTKQGFMEKSIFVDIAYNASLGQRYLNVTQTFV